jgi:kynureninase
MTYTATLDYARHRDAADSLRPFRERFALPRDESEVPLIYLCGHSLGLQPLAAREAVLQELDDWAKLGARGHEHARRPWIHYHEHLVGGLESLTGAQPGEVAAMSALTINLHLMLASFFQPVGARHKILIEAGAFPSDRHAVVSHLEWHGLSPRNALVELAARPGEDLVTEASVEDYLNEHGKEVALVLWPGVQFRTGQSFDYPRIVRAAQQAGCIAGLDLAHSIGNVPLSLHASNVDFAVWCSYKYLNGGPGAIGGCFVHERHGGTTSRARLAGWWGHEIATRFEMKPGFRAAAGAAGWQVSNPPILSAAPLVSSLAVFREAGLAGIREKSIALTGFLEFLLRPLGSDVRILTPDATARGAQLSIRVAGGTERGMRVFDWLGAHGVVCDWRGPDIVRAAPAPLYNSFEDVFHFSERLAQALREA